LRTYSKEGYDEEGGGGVGGWDTLARKWNKGGLMRDVVGVGREGREREVYRAVHKWRDCVAREDDESVRFVPSSSPSPFLSSFLPPFLNPLPTS
jgi:exosome complex exonuclease RRP6